MQHLRIIPFPTFQREKDYSCRRRSRDKSVKTHTFVRRNPREFCIIFLFFAFLSFYLFIVRIAREPQSGFVSCGGGGRNGKTRIVFLQLYFYIALLPVRVITSIACPFSIRVHYRITGSLYEIHPLFPPYETVFFLTFLLFPFPFFPFPHRLTMFHRENKNITPAVSYLTYVCTKCSRNAYNWRDFFQVN